MLAQPRGLASRAHIVLCMRESICRICSTKWMLWLIVCLRWQTRLLLLLHKRLVAVLTASILHDLPRLYAHYPSDQCPNSVPIQYTNDMPTIGQVGGRPGCTSLQPHIVPAFSHNPCHVQYDLASTQALSRLHIFTTALRIHSLLSS